MLHLRALYVYIHEAANFCTRLKIFGLDTWFVRYRSRWVNEVWMRCDWDVSWRMSGFLVCVFVWFPVKRCKWCQFGYVVWDEKCVLDRINGMWRAWMFKWLVWLSCTNSWKILVKCVCETLWNSLLITCEITKIAVVSCLVNHFLCIWLWCIHVYCHYVCHCVSNPLYFMNFVY